MYINSGTCIRQCVLPWLERIFDTEVVVADARFSIFKGLELVDLRVGGKDAPLLKASKVHIEGNLFRISKQPINIQRVDLEDVVIYITVNEQGRLDIPSAHVTPLDVPFITLAAAINSNLTVNTVRVDNFSLVCERKSKDPTQAISIAIYEFNGSLDSWLVGKPFEVSSQAKLQFSRGDHVHLNSDATVLTMTGLLGDDHRPNHLALSLRLDQLTGSMGIIPVAGRALHFDLVLERQDIRTIQIKHCNVSVSLDSEVEGYLSLTGKLSTQPISADLELVIATEQPGLSTLFTDLIGLYNFGDTLIDYQAQVRFDETSSVTSVNGHLQLNDFTMQSGQTPKTTVLPIDMDFRHALSFNKQQRRLQIDTCDLDARKSSKEIATIRLDQPVFFSLTKEAHSTTPPATFTVQLNEWDLNIINPFISQFAGFELKDGTLDSLPELKIIHTGRLTVIDGGVRLSNATIRLQDIEYRNTNIQISHQFTFDKTSQDLKIQTFNAMAKTDQELAFEIKLDGTVNVDRWNGTLDINTLRMYPPIERFVSQKLRMDYGINDFNCGGGLKVEFSVGDFVAVEGTLSSKDIRFTNSHGEQLPPISPTVQVHVLYNLSDPIQLGNNVITVSSPIGELAKITLSGELDYTRSTCNVSTEINLERLSFFMPDGYRWKLDAGRLSGNLDISVYDNDTQLSCSGQIQLCDLLPNQVNPFEKLLTPLDVGILPDVVYSKGKGFAVNRINICAENQTGPIAHADLTGRVNVGSSEVFAELRLVSLAPLDLKRLLTMASAVGRSIRSQLRLDEQNSEGIEQKGEEHNKLTLKLRTEIEIPEAYYDQIAIHDLIGNVVISENNINLAPVRCRINSGQLFSEALCNYSRAYPLKCDGRLVMEDVEIEPIILSITNSQMNTTLTGCIKTLDLKSMSTVTKTIDIDADVDVFLELQGIKCTNISDQFTPILNFLALEENHLYFDTISAHWRSNKDKGVLEIAYAEGPDVKLVSSGSVNFDGYWFPDLTLTLGYSEKLADLARQKAIKITEGDDGFFYTPPLPITIKSWETVNLVSHWLPQFSNTLFDLNPESKGFTIKTNEVDFTRTSAAGKQTDPQTFKAPVAGHINEGHRGKSALKDTVSAILNILGAGAPLE